MEIPWEFIKNIMQGIYKFTNKINGKIYIGQSVNLNNRYKQHISNYNNPSSSMYNTKFYRALRKYGLENFDYDIIEHSNYFTRDELNQKEIYYIEKYNSYQNGYNMNKEGNYTSGPKKLTDEQAHEIQNILITTRMTFEEISKKYCIQISTISYINNGQFWYNQNLSYPLRKRNINFCGSQNVNAKISDDEVMKIRKRYVNEPINNIYIDYQNQISFSEFKKICYGCQYKHLPIYKKRLKLWI